MFSYVIYCAKGIMASKEEFATGVSTILMAWITVDAGAILGAFAGAVLYTVIVSDSSINKLQVLK